MGHSLSWLAVKGKPAEVVLAELQLTSTGKPGEVGRSPVIASTSDVGWFLVVANRCKHHIISDAIVERLSTSCDAVTCTVEEHVMFSQATGWHDGRRLWSVLHRGDDDSTKKTVSEEGALPSEYFAIRDRFFRQQEVEDSADAEVDFIFEIPVVLAQMAAGYKHDEASPAFEARGFEILESTKKASFLGRFFGK